LSVNKTTQNYYKKLRDQVKFSFFVSESSVKIMFTLKPSTMKRSSNKSISNQFISFTIASLFLVSCGTYQSAYNEDGIYDSNTGFQNNNKIVIADTEAYNAYDNNYFTNELERLDDLSTETVFTDVDTYASADAAYVEDDLNYNTNASWGSNAQNDVVVHLNLNTNPYWNNFGFNNFGFNNFGFHNFGYNNWGYNRFGNNFGFSPYWFPYQNNLAFGWGFNNGFYHPYYGNSRNPFGYNRYNNWTNGNTRYQRRNTNTIDYNRRGVASRRSNKSRPVSFSSKREQTYRTAISTLNNGTPTSGNVRRNTSTRTNGTTRRNGTIRRNTSTSRSSSGTANTTNNNRSSSRNSSSTERGSRRSSSSRNSSSNSGNSASRSSRNSSSSSSNRGRSSGSRRSSSSSRRGNN
jgi:hypothetical protein